MNNGDCSSATPYQFLVMSNVQISYGGAGRNPPSPLGACNGLGDIFFWYHPSSWKDRQGDVLSGLFLSLTAGSHLEAKQGRGKCRWESRDRSGLLCSYLHPWWLILLMLLKQSKVLRTNICWNLRYSRCKRAWAFCSLMWSVCVDMGFFAFSFLFFEEFFFSCSIFVLILLILQVCSFNFLLSLFLPLLLWKLLFLID